MKVTIIGRKVNLRDNFKELVKKKLSRFDRIFDEDAEAKFVVTLERNRQTVEITIRSRGMLYRAASTSDAMNTALDDAIRALGNQIRRNKKRLSKRLRGDVAGALEPAEREGEEPDEQTRYAPVRTKRFVIQPMSPEEAILQMDLLDHQFFLFRNVETGEINVVYRRKDGGFGLLEPDGE